MDTIAEMAAVLAALISAVLLGFQTYWALGGTKWLGGAWGGAYSELPLKLRIGSAGSAVMFLIAAAFVLAEAGFWDPDISPSIITWATRIFAGIFLLSSLANFVSSSKWERYLNGPSSLALAGLFLIVAIN